jgi:hypothetical protein
MVMLQRVAVGMQIGPEASLPRLVSEHDISFVQQRFGIVVKSNAAVKAERPSLIEDVENLFSRHLMQDGPAAMVDVLS